MKRPFCGAPRHFASGCAEAGLGAYAIAQWTALSTYALNAIVEVIDVTASNGRFLFTTKMTVDPRHANEGPYAQSL
ncbi:hypothetical protein C1D09_008975 [Mesorhizobium intechi]|uniref:hypothetical protein n=1 Tax=Mesorhizobium intechi TaxID=537601 RepID=UPI000CA68626|nr:hypothetical protein [Mesorhizobium intechi]TSE12459.1 hypothetical protein C1D09_008975 [Mesorhizobium intechi]